MKNINFRKLATLSIFCLFFALFLLIIVFVRYQDMWDHACFARQMLSGVRPTAGNFLFYWLVNVFSFFSTKIIPSKISLCFLLAIATTYRYYWSQKKIFEIVNYGRITEYNYWKPALLSISLIFAFAIPIPSLLVNKSFYIGNFVPNIWHNSTTIFLFPFALFLFDLSYKQLNTFNTRRNIWIALLIFLNIFIKPSYFFVYVCTFPIFLLIKYHFKKEFWLSIIPSIIGLLLLFIEYWTIYQTTNANIQDSSSIVFHLFYSYKLTSNLWQLPFALFFSLLFPLCYSLFNINNLKNNLLFWFTFFSFLISILIYFFIGESGPRATHGNFYWQVVICTWLCYFWALIALIKDIKEKSLTLKNKILLSIYMLHVAIGLIYFVKLFVVGNYY